MAENTSFSSLTVCVVLIALRAFQDYDSDIISEGGLRALFRVFYVKSQAVKNNALTQGPIFLFAKSE